VRIYQYALIGIELEKLKLYKMQNTINALPAQVTNSSTILTSIFTTTNYSIFDFIGGNRETDNTNLNKIKQSLSKKHIRTNAVICILDNTDPIKPLKIVDGQHRFKACKELNIPVSFVIDSSLTMASILNDITLLNTASKEWDVSDFMRSEAQKGNENYILYSAVYGQYFTSFDHESLFYILNNDINRTCSKISYPSFKAGELIFDHSDYNYLIQRISNISQFNHFNEIGGKRYYQKALNQLLNTKGFNMNQMLVKLQARQSTITKCTTVEGALKQLADIYNYKIQSGRILFLGAGGKIEDIIIK
jgi:hypothetical protein